MTALLRDKLATGKFVVAAELVTSRGLISAATGRGVLETWAAITTLPPMTISCPRRHGSRPSQPWPGPPNRPWPPWEDHSHWYQTRGRAQGPALPSSLPDVHFIKV